MPHKVGVQVSRDLHPEVQEDLTTPETRSSQFRFKEVLRSVAPAIAQVCGLEDVYVGELKIATFFSLL